MKIWRFALPVTAAVALVVGLAGIRGVHAASQPVVTVLVPHGASAGVDAPVTIRAEGQQPELATLDYEAIGGEVTGLVSLSVVAPGIAEATVYVRRAAPGDASLRVRSNGVVVAWGTVGFAAAGTTTVNATPRPPATGTSMAAGGAHTTSTFPLIVLLATALVAPAVLAGSRVVTGVRQR